MNDGLLKVAISGRVSRNSHAHVVNEIGQAIINGTYEIGTVLPGDAELAEQFGVSRTVLREAMKTLAAKGLVVPRAKIGTRVTERTKWNFFDSEVLNWHLENGLDQDFLRHLSEMRLSFEPFAARLAVHNATQADIDRLFEHAEQMRVADSTEAMALADLAFHLALLDASKNPFMYSVGSLIEAALVTTFRLSSPAGGEGQAHTAEKHRLVAVGIASGDADTAAAAVETVIIEGRDRVSGKIDKST